MLELAGVVVACAVLVLAAWSVALYRRSTLSARNEHSTRDERSRNLVTGAVTGTVVQATTIEGSVIVSHAPIRSGRLAETADQLAHAIGARWRLEEDRRRIQDPFPLPIRFRPADDALTDHPMNIARRRPGRPAKPLDVSGDLNQITDVFERIPLHRLVVLGRAGSGKSVLAMRFVLDLLRARVPGEPVPVIFGLGSWNPAIPLDDWLATQLIRDHPGLAELGTDNQTLAAELVEARWILPVLDGFDEIAAGLHHAALEELSSTGPLLLTSRTDEYAAAVAGTRGLPLAAVVELTDLTLDDVADYLPRTSPRLVRPGNGTVATVTTAWDVVLDRLRAEPENPAVVHLARVLTTPLMVALARTVYSDAADRSPTELLDTSRFTTPDLIEDHLLESFLPSIYRMRPGHHRAARLRSYDPEHARRWLTYLAEHLQRLGTRNLAWWELGTSMHRSSRTVLISFLAGLAFGAATGIGNIPVDVVGASLPLAFAVKRGLVVGAMHGLVIGLTFGVLYWFVDASDALRPSPVRMRVLGGPRQARTKFATRIRLGILGGFVGGMIIVVIDRALVPQLGLDDGLGGGFLQSAVVFPPLVGLGTGAVFALVTWLEVPIDVRSAVSPVNLLNSNRMNALIMLLMWALVFDAAAWLVNSFTVGPLRSFEVGLVFGLEAGFGGGLGYGLSLTAWGQWVALSRMWLPATGRLPWRLIAFLDDACQRGVLRQAGAVYQFRHARLQDRLTAKDSTEQRSGT